MKLTIYKNVEKPQGFQFGLWGFLGFTLVLIFVSSCSSLLYHPTFFKHSSPESLNLTPEEIWIKVNKVESIYGWYFHSTDSKKPIGTLVFFHGNAENLSSHYLNLIWILSYGFDFFIFDYRGYGRSKGDPSPESTVLDGVSVLRYISKRSPERPLIVFGQSLGGAVALKSSIMVKDQVPIKLIVVDSSFLSYRSAARNLLSQHWYTWLLQPLSWFVLSDTFAPLDEVHQISPVPLIVIHGDKDEIVDLSLGKEIYEKARQPKEFWQVPDGKHIDVFEHPTFRGRFVKSLQNTVVRGSHHDRIIDK